MPCCSSVPATGFAAKRAQSEHRKSVEQQCRSLRAGVGRNKLGGDDGKRVTMARLPAKVAKSGRRELCGCGQRTSCPHTSCKAVPSRYAGTHQVGERAFKDYVKLNSDRNVRGRLLHGKEHEHDGIQIKPIYSRTTERACLPKVGQAHQFEVICAEATAEPRRQVGRQALQQCLPVCCPVRTALPKFDNRRPMCQ